MASQSTNPDSPLPQVVLITGCSSGIGQALALEFHQQGYRVYATARHPERMQGLAQKGISTLQLDVTRPADIHTVINILTAETQGIDILVNNAGYAVMGPLLDIPNAEFVAQFQTNVFAPIHLIQQVVPLMGDGGLILNLGSVSGIMSTPFAGPYCASKAALHALSDALRMELAPFNIQVVTVRAGAIQSQFGQTASHNVERLLPSNSRYQSLTPQIQARAQASQNQATPAAVLAQKLVHRIQHSHRLPPEIAIGNKSLTLPLLKRWLPTRLLDRILMRKFGLRDGQPPQEG
ncbi:SDR family oxidoreductase [Acaryochloris sp. IP29b_bin.148]|uniref:SDR family oxidoreductase n=1 Tax=Acaryochloris sp. IP29b_bin.148 TaxID=2969218 RepID=UPI00262DAE20|nr:SDR family oxidoreductase [Acaryochloris sp. IP29b_bin.148]